MLVYHTDCYSKLPRSLSAFPYQNLLFMRLANTWVEALLNKEHVASIHVQLLEDVGVEGEGGMFDQYGIIRDVMHNHLLQVRGEACFTAEL